MKPRIYKDKVWHLQYGYFPRMFSLFGLEGAERKEVIKQCVADNVFDTWAEAVNYLKYLIQNRMLRRT